MVVRLLLAGSLVFALSLLDRPCLAADPSSAARESRVVRFEPALPGDVVVRVFIGGAGPFRFLVDTGSSHSAVTEDLATRLAARPVARSSMSTATGTVECLIVSLSSVDVGAAQAAELLATVLPGSASQALGPNVDGVLGVDFLGQFNFTLDYRRSELEWGDGRLRLEAERLPLRSVAGRFLVDLPQASGSIATFVPDSGASDLVVLNAAAFRLERAGTARHVDTLTGGGTVENVTVHALRVGRRTLRNVSAAVAEGRFGPERGDGLLPLRLFNRVHFNHREGYLTVE